jgi:DNA-binding cell septation regulator SpoVG
VSFPWPTRSSRPSCFVVSDIKIIEGPSGLFISMPSRRRRDGSFRDVAHPLNHETRRMFEERILATYREIPPEDRVGEARQRAAEDTRGVAGPVGAPRPLAGGDDPSWA